MDNKDFQMPTNKSEDWMNRREFLGLAATASCGALSALLFSEATVHAQEKGPEVKRYEVIRRFGGVDLSKPYATVATAVDSDKKFTNQMQPILVNTQQLLPTDVSAFDRSLNKSLIFGTDTKAIVEYAHTWRNNGNPLAHEWYRRLLEAQIAGADIRGYEIPFQQAGIESISQVVFATKVETRRFWAARLDTGDKPFQLRLGDSGLGLPNEIVELCNQKETMIIAGCADKGSKRHEFVNQMVMVATLK